MSRDIVLPGGDKLQLFDSHYTSQQVEDILTKALRQPGTNLLDNWYFVGGGSQQGGGQLPINQRGQTEYTTAGYTIDRWALLRNTTLTLTSDCIRLAPRGSPGVSFIYQKLENPAIYAGKQTTFSVLLRAPAVGGYIAFFGTNYISLGDTDFAAGTNGLVACSVVATDGLVGVGIAINSVTTATDDLQLYAAKLELGSQQTLAHQDAEGNWVLNDPPPNYQQELAKCQRYQIPFRYANSDLRVRASVLNGTDYLFFMVPVPTSLRGSPTIENADDLAVTTIKNEFRSGFIFNVQGYGPGYVMIIAYKQNHGLNDGCLLSWKSPNPPLFNSNL